MTKSKISLSQLAYQTFSEYVQKKKGRGERHEEFVLFLFIYFFPFYNIINHEEFEKVFVVCKHLARKRKIVFNNKSLQF